jgi:hypothetical protein
MVVVPVAVNDVPKPFADKYDPVPTISDPLTDDVSDVTLRLPVMFRFAAL